MSKLLKVFHGFAYEILTDNRRRNIRYRITKPLSIYPYRYSCTCTRLKSWLPTKHPGMLRWYNLSASSAPNYLWS